MIALFLHNKFVFTLRSSLHSFLYRFLYFFTSTRYRIKAHGTSWVILKAFDPSLFIKRIITIVATFVALIVALITILALV